MADDILVSIHGSRLGITNKGALVQNPYGTGTKALARADYVLAAAGTALTASSTETVMASYTIPANTLAVGSLIQVRAQAIVTAANSTDTFTFKLRIGGLAGTLLWTVAATDATANDICTGEFELAIRTIGSSGTLVGVGTFKSIPAAEGTMTIKDDILASTAIDTTANQDVCVTGQFSSTSAGNSARVDFFRVIVA